MIDGRNKSATCARKVLDYFFLIGELKKIVGNYFGGGPHTHVYVLRRLHHIKRTKQPHGASHARIRAPPFISKKEDILFLVLSRACTRPFFL